MTEQSLSAAELGATTVNERNPWLGLASFTEETRAYFYGRDEEVAELARRVQRKLLTVLFGQSGLGKTSILRAGLVPRLRDQGYCPIYVRIDYGPDAPEPAEQIKQAISRTARHAGEWTRTGVAVEGESLWEFLHHRDDVLRDEAGATLIPLLIFDQFEEIFTLAQSDDFGRARSARFIEELADLVENRLPKAVEARLDDDDTAAERFDFSRGDYRVLIALREDYLAPLEGLKKAMPSIAQNRLRLAPMTGTQALAAVLQPGKKLVSEEVAAAIVRFVAGGAELANAEVEPSLLSLICRELNDARIAQGRSEISLDLLAGSHATILSNFYERALADQLPAVRQIIEDELLTSGGYRENVAEERIVGRFQAVGAAPNTLAVLVNRRLLRIEERLDHRRVELTHDVLCGVVKASRDLRREREAREETERVLGAQRERELSARRALVRARKVAAACTVLAVGAVVAAVFAVVSGQRAHRAEREAQETRRIAERARAGSEHLLGYLNDDFVRELESFGRLNVLAEFSKRQIDYFHALPVALKGPETVRNGALAMVYYARAMRYLGDLDVAGANANEGVQLLEQLRADGDLSEATTVALTLAYVTQTTIMDTENDPAGITVGRRAVALIRPLAEAKDGSLAARRAYVAALVRVTFEQQSFNDMKGSIETGQLARRYAWELGGRDLSNLEMAAYYAEASAWMVNGLIGLGRNDEAHKLGIEAIAIADKVLEQRPGFRLALHAEEVVEGGLTTVALNDLDPAESLRIAKLDDRTSETLLRLDPKNTVSNNNMSVAHSSEGDALWAAGRLREALPYYVKSLDDLGRAATGGAGYVILRSYSEASTSFRQALTGDFAGADATVASGQPFLAKLRETELPGSVAVVLVDASGELAAAGVAMERGDLPAARKLTAAAMAQLVAAKPQGEFHTNQLALTRYYAGLISGRAAYLAGDFAAAERFLRESLVSRKAGTTDSVGDHRDLGEISTWLALSLARQGKRAEAAQTIAPVLKFQRGLATKNRGDQWIAVELAAALYAQGLADPPHGAAQLKEAATLLDGLIPSIRGVHDVQLWRDRVREAQHGT
jgi:hypothetical protein